MWKFILNILKFIFSIKPVEIQKPTITPVKPVGGLLSMNLKVKDLVGKIFDDPAIMGLFKGKVDLQKKFNLSFPVDVHVNSDQVFSLQLIDGSIVLKFHDTCPHVEVQKILDLD